MDDEAGTDLADRGRDAAAAGDWSRAYELLRRADEVGRLTADDLAVLADVAYADGHLAVTIGAWERVHAEAVRSGDLLVAAGAATRVALHLLMDTALMAPVRGWVRRAERLLEGYDAAPDQAWICVIRSYERLMTGDLDAAGGWARRAVELGTERNPAAAAVGRVAEAHALVLSGETRRGLELVEEAAVATVSGELDALATGMVYCELVCMLQGLAQYDLAEEWTAAMERWHPHRGVGSVHGRCRVHRAEILRLRGATDEAEQEALAACAELRPYLRREFGWPLTELGQARLQRGDLAGAETAFLEAREAGWDPEPGLALVRLAQGDVAGAAASLRDALDHPSAVPSKERPPNTDLRRAPLLAARVQVDVAAGDVRGAREAADELAGVAATYESQALRAAAAVAAGRASLAESDPVRAAEAFAAALDLWTAVGAPHEVASSRSLLAQAEGVATSDSGVRPRPTGTEPIGALSRSGDPRGEPHVLRREGDYWLVSYEGHDTAIRDLLGLRYLARLLAHPGRELHALDLVSSELDPATRSAGATGPGPTPSRELGTGPLLDAQAKASYRRRLEEIEEDLEDAERMRDEARVAQAEHERDFLMRELSRAVGLGGRDRRAGSASERARVSATRAIRHAVDRIGRHDPALGQHLDRAVQTGTYCAYLPDSPTTATWSVS